MSRYADRAEETSLEYLLLLFIVREAHDTTHHEASHRVQGGVEDEGGWVGGARRGHVHKLLDGQRLGLEFKSREEKWNRNGEVGINNVEFCQRMSAVCVRPPFSYQQTADLESPLRVPIAAKSFCQKEVDHHM